MTAQRAIDISKFYAIGINYKKSNATTRGLFAVTTEQYAVILENATSKGFNELFILSTCNST